VNSTSRIQREIELHADIADDYRVRYGHPFSIFYNRYWNQRILSFLPKDEQLRVLDLSCGTGFLLVDLVRLHPSSVGLDISEAMLTVAREKKAIRRRLVVGNGVMLPFPERCFDAVVCRGSLHHLPDLQQALAEIRRILVPGGTFVFSEPSNDALIIRLARKLMYHISEKFDEEDEGYHLAELSATVRSAGFDHGQWFRFGLLGYVFAGFPDRLGWLKHLPGSIYITRFFILLDRGIEKVPGLRRLCFQILGVVQKPVSHA